MFAHFEFSCTEYSIRSAETSTLYSIRSAETPALLILR